MIYALLDAGDRGHAEAAGWYLSTDEELATTPLVLAEVDHLLARVGGQFESPSGGTGRPHAEARRTEGQMRRRRLGLLLAATSAAAATMALSAPSAFGGGEGRGATIEEFVCFRSTGDQVRLGTGKVITTPSGNVRVVCTGEPL